MEENLVEESLTDSQSPQLQEQQVLNQEQDQIKQNESENHTSEGDIRQELVKTKSEDEYQEEIQKEKVEMEKEGIHNIIENERMKFNMDIFKAQLKSLLYCIPGMIFLYYSNCLSYLVYPSDLMLQKWSFWLFRIEVFFSLIIKFTQRFILKSIFYRGLDLVEKLGKEGIDELDKMNREKEKYNNNDQFFDQIFKYLGEFVTKKDSLKFLGMIIIKPILSIYEYIFDPVGFFFLFFALWSYYSFYSFLISPVLYLAFKNVFGIFPENTYIGVGCLLFVIYLYWSNLEYYTPFKTPGYTTLQDQQPTEEF